MPKRVTEEDLAASADALAKAKKGRDPDRAREASEEHAALRTAWRLQEEQAGRRVGLVAISEDGEK